MISRRNYLGLVVLLALPGCADSEAPPFVEFAGGGFVFNYRTANHFYGFVVKQIKPLPAGSKLRVTFEIPGGKEEVQEIATIPGRLQYKFQTGDLDGIEAGHQYRAILTLLDGKTGRELDRLEKTFATEVDQSKLPQKPLVVGPGYEQPKN
jgi:hypothetical protein